MNNFELRRNNVSSNNSIGFAQYSIKSFIEVFIRIVELFVFPLIRGVKFKFVSLRYANMMISKL